MARKETVRVVREELVFPEGQESPLSIAALQLTASAYRRMATAQDKHGAAPAVTVGRFIYFFDYAAIREARSLGILLLGTAEDFLQGEGIQPDNSDQAIVDTARQYKLDINKARYAARVMVKAILGIRYILSNQEQLDKVSGKDDQEKTANLQTMLGLSSMYELESIRRIRRPSRLPVRKN
jgi:hypothetical protein